MRIKTKSFKYLLLLIPFIMPGIVQILPGLSIINLLRNVGRYVSFIIIVCIAVLDLLYRKNKTSKIFIAVVLFQAVALTSTLINSVDIRTTLEVIAQILCLTFLVEHAFIHGEGKPLIQAAHFIFSIYIYIDLVVMIISPNLADIANGGIFAGKNTHIWWIIPFLILSYLLINRKNYTSIIFFCVESLSSVAILLLANSSTGIMVIVFEVGLLLLNFLRADKIKNIYSKVLLGFIILNFLLLSSNLLSITDRVVSFFNKQTTFGRYEIWKVALLYISQKPILGFGYEFAEQIASKIRYSQMHNKFLDVTYTMGIIGLIVFVYMCFVLTRSLDKNINKKDIAIIGSLFFAYFVEFLTEGSRYEMVFFFMISVVYHVAINRLNQDQNEELVL